MVPSSAKYNAVLKRRVAEHRQWLLDPDIPAMKLRNVSAIRDEIHKDQPGREMRIAASLRVLAVCFANEGLVALVDNKQMEGWCALHRYWLYQSLGLRILFSFYEKQHRVGRLNKALELETGRTAFCLAYAVVFNQDVAVKFLSRALTTMLMDGTVVRPSHWNKHRLEGFIARLIEIDGAGNTIPASGKPKAIRSECPYSQLLASWEDADELQKTLIRACDYHCACLEPSDEDDFDPEFDEPPFDLIPIEMMALFTVRKRLGLKIEFPKHPLLDETFTSARGSPSCIDDELLNEIEIEF